MDFSDDSRGSSGRWEGAGGVRPVSRRGLREYSGHAPPDHGRSGSMRPNSAYRGVSGTASRLGSSAAPPTATARQPTAMSGFAMTDRPATQGLSGLRTGTARGFRSRHLQDKRYWEEVLQLKMREMKAEIGRLHEVAETRERHKSARKHYEKRVKELAHELTDLQGRLSDYNTAIRIATGEISRQAVEEQAQKLEVANEKAQAEVEQVFLEKQRKEMQLKQIIEQTEKEQSSIAHILSEMSPAEKQEYVELESTASRLREEAQRAKSQLELLQKNRDELNKDIAISQVKVHMVELYRRLAAAEEERDSIKREMENKLQPHEEREKLLTQVREDNAAITSMDSNAASLKEQIQKVEELIEHAEQDLEEGNSERHQKYRELRKREETMDSFMSTYEDALKKELDKIEQLESNIVFALEHSSSNIDVDLGEIDLLKQKEGYGSDIKSVEGLIKEYERMKGNLKKAESIRERLAAELETLPGKCSAMENELVTLGDLERLQEQGAEQKKALEAELEQVREKLAPTESAVREASTRLKALQASLEGNDMYSRLVTLEDKLAQLEQRRNVLEEDIASVRSQSDYRATKEQALEKVAALNNQIIADLNSSAKSY